MKNRILSPLVVLMATFALLAGAAVAQAQDRTNQPSDQTTNQQHSQQSDQRLQRDRTSAQSRPESATRSQPRGGSETATRNSVERDHNRAEAARAPAERPAPPRRVASADRGTEIARYRREHPHAAARCHDGFFTNTTDRHRACSKHGGIEIWLLP